MEKRTPINKNIVESRMKMPLTEYLQKCIDLLESMNDKGLLQGLGELMEDSMKKFVQNGMRSETISLLKFYKEFPSFVKILLKLLTEHLFDTKLRNQKNYLLIIGC